MSSPTYRTHALWWIALVSVVCSAGCEESGPCIYTARAYRAESNCLEPYQPLALVEAAELPSTCQPTCLRIAEQLYVSVVCPPYPVESTVETAEDSPECLQALARLAEQNSCDSTASEDAGATEETEDAGATEETEPLDAAVAPPDGAEEPPPEVDP